MSRLILAFILALVTPVLSAQTDTGTVPMVVEMPSMQPIVIPANTIPFKVYQHKPADGVVQTWTNTMYIPEDLMDQVVEGILNVPKHVLIAVIDSVKSTGCAAVQTGSITVSLTVSLEAKAWVVGVGVGSGFSVTFDCEGGEAE